MAANLDWTEIVDSEFADNRDLRDLYGRKFFGKVVINFVNGWPVIINDTKSHLGKREKERRRAEKDKAGRPLPYWAQNDDDTHTN